MMLILSQLLPKQKIMQNFANWTIQSYHNDFQKISNLRNGTNSHCSFRKYPIYEMTQIYSVSFIKCQIYEMEQSHIIVLENIQFMK